MGPGFRSRSRQEPGYFPKAGDVLLAQLRLQLRLQLQYELNNSKI